MSHELLIEWNEAKNTLLKQERGVCFEDVLQAIEDGKVLEDAVHPNHEKYGHQRILVVEIRGYACVVPYVIDGNKQFFKTVFKSRFYQKRYLVD